MKSTHFEATTQSCFGVKRRGAGVVVGLGVVSFASAEGVGAVSIAPALQSYERSVGQGFRALATLGGRNDAVLIAAPEHEPKSVKQKANATIV